MVNQMHQNRTFKIFCSITILLVPFCLQTSLCMRRKGCITMSRLALRMNKSPIQMSTGLYFPGRKVDIAFTHLMLHLMVCSDLPSYLHAFEGMVLRTGINFIFSHSNDDHKVIRLRKHK